MATRKQEVEMSNQEILDKHMNYFDEMATGLPTKLLEQHLIDLLFRLDGYFADEFTPEEIVRMKYNISADFPIFLETSIGNDQHKALAAENECRAHLSAIQTRETRIEDCERDIAGLNNRLKVILNNAVSVEISSDSLINSILAQFSRTQVIMEKLNQGIALNEEELKVVQSRITNY